MNEKQLNDVIELHQKWLNGEPDGTQADLGGVILIGADLHGYNLTNVCFKDTILINADLSNTVLTGSNFHNAILRNANLEGAVLPEFQIQQEGELIVYKKCVGNSIAKLSIPTEAKRTATLVNAKCRAEYAYVIDCFMEKTEKEKEEDNEDYKSVTELSGLKSKNLKYRVGEYVYPDSYDDDIKTACSNGIHFFLTFQEAVDYY